MVQGVYPAAYFCSSAEDETPGMTESLLFSTLRQPNYRVHVGKITAINLMWLSRPLKCALLFLVTYKPTPCGAAKIVVTGDAAPVVGQAASYL